MCYILFGGINEEVSINDLAKVENKSNFIFSTVSKIQERVKYFPRITQCVCDCGTPIGSDNDKDPKRDVERFRNELQDFADYIHDLRNVRNIKHIWIQKIWYGDETERELIFHIDDIDLITLLAGLKEKNVYRIQLFKRDIY